MIAALEANLAAIMGARTVIVDRRPNPQGSTCPSEIVTCRLDDGRELHLLWKRAPGPEHAAFGHRGGVGYEALVYREVVTPSRLPAPRFWGELDGDSGFVLEFFEGAVSADEATPIEDAMAIAARWAGRFHRINEESHAPLTRYDAAYYRVWPRRTQELAKRWHGRLPWLAELCRRAERFMPTLVEQPTTVIHGEFTPHNVLIRAGEAYPVDWESAAIALGEIDLACLIDKWPAKTATRCEHEYQAARWHEGAPADFERRLDLARLYWNFRWLGDRPEWTSSEKVGPRFEQLRIAAERLELL